MTGVTLSGPVENDFARVPRPHQLEAILEFGVGKAVGNDGRNVEPALN